MPDDKEGGYKPPVYHPEEAKMITGIQHMSFTVSNLGDTMHFFSDILGLEVSPIREAKGGRVEKILQIDGASLRICNVITPDNGNIEFIEYVAPEGRKNDPMTCNIGVAHVGFTVDDLQKVYEDLAAKGVKFNHPPVWTYEGPMKGWGVCYAKGPDGITLEFMQPPKGVKLHPATGLVAG